MHLYSLIFTGPTHQTTYSKVLTHYELKNTWNMGEPLTNIDMKSEPFRYRSGI